MADGIGIVLLLRLKYRQKIERITGSDLFNACLEIADRKSLRIALVGSSAETLFLLSEEIRIKWPSVILLTLSPEYEFEKSPELNNRIVNDVKSFSPHILLVALGCPRQEKWIFSHKDYIGAKINIGVGAVFDFYSGTKKRAPLFLQSIVMEWFWRLLREPVRLGKRYLVKDLPFFIITLFRIMFKLESKRAEQI